MTKAKMTVSKDYRKVEIDPRIYGSFVEHLGSVVYGGIYDEEHPKADENGFRQDVMNLVKKLKIPILRYPGGNFVSAFDWKDSIGPKKDRPVRLDLAWKLREPNSFGLHEFMRWIEQAGSLPMYTINLGTRGIQDARDIVEYCNFSSGTYWSDLRRKNGAENPFKIKTWCLGNELDGKWQIGQMNAEDYGIIARESAKAMKIIDPDIETVAIGSSNMHKNWVSTYPDWDLRTLLECYDEVEYISIHHYIMEKEEGASPEEFLAHTLEIEQNIIDIISVCDYVKAKRESRKKLYISLDEWNANAFQRPKPDKKAVRESWTSGKQWNRTFNNSMEGALAVGAQMIAIIRHADRVKIGCMAMLIGGRGIIDAEIGGDAWETFHYYILQHAILYGNGTLLDSALVCNRYDTKQFEGVPVMDSVAVLDEKNNRLTIFAVNRTREEINLNMNLQGFNEFKKWDHILMCSDDVYGQNTADNRYAIVPKLCANTRFDDNGILSRLQPYSWNVINFYN